MRLLVARCLRVAADPSKEQVLAHAGRADAKDLPLLVAALRERCPFLVTFNRKDYRPGHPDVAVVTPGALVRRIRERLVRLPSE